MRALLLLSLMLPAKAAFSETSLKGEFKFSKKPPKAALIYFEDDTSGVKNQATIDQVKQSFDQKLYVVNQGQKFKIKNSDDIDHNIYANDKKTGTEFDVGLGKPGASIEQVASWASGSVIKIGCMIHPKMKSYVAALKSGYFKVVEFKKSDRNVSFELKDVPKGLKSIRIWMPKYDAIAFDLSTGEKTIDLIRKKKNRGSVKLSRQ